MRFQRHFTVMRQLLFAALLCTTTFMGLSACQKTTNERGIASPSNKAAFSTFLANLPTPEEKAIEALKSTNDFAGINAGIQGVSLPSYFAYRALLKNPKAPEIFYAILNEGKMPGQLYALCGLYETDRETFNNVIAKYVNRSDYRVMTLDNVAREQTVSQIAVKIADGTWPERLRTAEPTYYGGIPESEWEDFFGPWEYVTD